jgi:hypothetical protein
MLDTDPCELCGTDAETVVSREGTLQRCPRCGDFKLPRTADILRVPPSDRIKISGWVRDQNALGDVPELTSDRIGLIVASPTPGIVERADRLLSYAIRDQSRLGEKFNINSPHFLAVTYSHDRDEVMYLAQFLSDVGLINLETIGGETGITPHGYMRYEALRTQSSASAQGFVAMWFHRYA